MDRRGRAAPAGLPRRARGQGAARGRARAARAGSADDAHRARGAAGGGAAPAPRRLAQASATSYGTPTTVLGVRITNPEKPLFPDSAFPKLVARRVLRRDRARDAAARRRSAADARSLPSRPRPGLLLPAPPRRRALAADTHASSHTLTGHKDADELLFVDSAEGLVALAQMGALEIHTWLSRVDAPTRPDRIVFDLDPGPGVDVAADLLGGSGRSRASARRSGFAPFVKSTGQQGSARRAADRAGVGVRARACARQAIVDRMVGSHPDTLTGKMAKDARGGRIFLDYLRNAEGASAVAPYSTRNLSGPSCSVPLAWDELHRRPRHPSVHARARARARGGGRRPVGRHRPFRRGNSNAEGGREALVAVFIPGA